MKCIELQNDKKSCFASIRPVEASDSLTNKVLLFKGKIAHKNPLSIILFFISIRVYGPTLPSKEIRLWLIIFIVCGSKSNCFLHLLILDSRPPPSPIKLIIDKSPKPLEKIFQKNLGLNIKKLEYLLVQALIQHSLLHYYVKNILQLKLNQFL